MNKDKKLIEEARKTVALITSYTKDSEWAEKSPLMYEIFQDYAKSLNAALGDDKWDWNKEFDKDKRKDDEINKAFEKAVKQNGDALKKLSDTPTRDWFDINDY